MDNSNKQAKLKDKEWPLFGLIKWVSREEAEELFPGIDKKDLEDEEAKESDKKSD